MLSQPSHLDGSWQGTLRHSGVPSSSLFNYHWASGTWREQEALDLNDSSLFSIAPTLKPAPEGLLSWQRFRRRCHLKVTDRDFADRWSLDLIKTIQAWKHLPSSVSDAAWQQKQLVDAQIRNLLCSSLDFQREALLHFSSCVTRCCILTVWFGGMKSDGCSDASWQKCPDRDLEEHQWSLFVRPPPYFLFRITFHVISYHWHLKWKWPTTV